MDYIEELIAIVKKNLEKTEQKYCYSMQSKYGNIYYGLDPKPLTKPQEEPISAYIDAIRDNFSNQKDYYGFLSLDKEDILFEIIKLKPDAQSLGKMLCYFFDGQEGRHLYFLSWMDNRNPEHRKAMIYMIANTYENHISFNETPIYLTTKFKQINSYFDFTLEELKLAFTPYFKNNTIITDDIASFFIARCIKKENQQAIRAIIPQMQKEISLFESESDVSYLVLKKNYLVLHYPALQVDVLERDKKQDPIYMLLDFIGQQINEHHYMGIKKILITQQWNNYLISASFDNNDNINVFKELIHEILAFCETVTEKNFTNLNMYPGIQNQIKSFIQFWITNHNVEKKLIDNGINIEDDNARTSSLKI
jgi:hypothetical protein